MQKWLTNRPFETYLNKIIEPVIGNIYNESELLVIIIILQ
jgi:hypothetical protein